MTRYEICRDDKINDLLTKLLNQPNEIKVSEKLILIGNLSELLNYKSGTIVNTLNILKSKNSKVRTSIAPSTLNNLLSDLHVALSSGYNFVENIKDKYDYLDITKEIDKNRVDDTLFEYVPEIKILDRRSSNLNGKNDELLFLIQNLNLDLIIKIYIVALGLL